MSWIDKEIDEIFLEANLNQEVPIYQDSYFDEITHLLPKKRSKKNIFILFSSVTLSLVVLISFFTYDKNSSSNKTLQTKNVSKSKLIEKNKNLSSNRKVAETFSNKNEKAIQKTDLQISENLTNNLSMNLTHKQKYTLAQKTIKHNNTEDKSSLNSEIYNKISNQYESSLQVKSQLTDDEKNSWSDFKEKEEVIDVNNLVINGLVNFENINSEFEIESLLLPMKKAKNKFYTEFSLGFSESFANSNSSSTIQSSNQTYKSFSFASGYQFIENKYIYEIGFNYMSYRISDLILSRQSKVYGFEVNKYSQNIDYKNVNVVELPVSILRRFKNQQLGVGVSTGFVLGSTIQFTKSENDIQQVNEKIYWNKLGMNNFTLRPSLTYAIAIDDYEIGARLSCNILNPLTNDKFENSINKNPFQAQISLRKTFKIK
jgi:hypothetical protein